MSASDASQQANRAGMDPQRLVIVSYLVFGIVIALFLGHVLSLLFARFGVTDGTILDQFKYSEVGGVALAIGGAIFCWVNPKIRQQALDVANELMRVTWPSWEETRISTFAVVVASLVAAIVLFGIDRFSYELMIEWLPSLWGKL